MDTNPSEEIQFGELLKRFRKRRRWNQKQLGDKIGASREAVSFWERGDYKPETDTTVHNLVGVLGFTEQEKQQLFEAYTVTALATSFHNPPFMRNLYFTGRSAQLKQLHTLLMAGKQVALTQAISGLGGIGKTQLALEYAYRYQKSYHDIFWVSADADTDMDTEESWMASYVRLAGLLHLPEYEEADQNKAKDAVHRWLRKHTNWLLILDNVEDFSLLQQFVPDDRQGAVLLTTRRGVTEPVAQALELELLPENDAILFLLKRTKRLAVNRSLEEASEHDIEAAKAVTRLLGNLPLALDQAGAYILETQCGFAEYLTLFQTCRGQLLQRRIAERMPTDHPESVTATFTLNFQQIQRQNSAAGELLSLFAFLSPDAIPEEIVTAGASSLRSVLASVAVDAFQFNQAIEVLYAYSLVQRDLKGKTLSVHRLVQVVLQDAIEEGERHIWRERGMQAVNAAFPHAEHETWPQCERLLVQALFVAQLIDQYQVIDEGAGRLLYETASYLKDRGRQVEAEPLYRKALHIQEQQLGPEHPDVAHALNGLASLYFEQSKYMEAEPLYQQALHIWGQQLKPEYPEMANALTNLATLYLQQGKYTEAESFYQRALYIWEQQLGPPDPRIAYTLSGLGVLYFQQQGRYAEAEALLRRALRIREQQLGPEHPDVAYALNNLATFYREQRRYAEAEPLYQQASYIWERQLGPEHPLVAHPLSNLADLHRQQGRYAEAESLFQRALHIREQRFGSEHTDVAYSFGNMGTLYLEQGKYAEAESFYQRALSILNRQLGSEHPDVAFILIGLADTYLEQGKYAEAEPLYQQAIRQLGLEHPLVSFALNGLANLYREQERYTEAEPLYQQALAIWEQQLGPEHPDVANALNGLANLYLEQGKYVEAKPLFQRALRIREQQLGSDHPATAETVADVAALREAQENYEGAESLYIRALAIREQALGAHHPRTMETHTRLVSLLRAAGKHEEAARLEAVLAEQGANKEEGKPPARE
jgi:tetratricopeptide (TPR) repeat protein/DNA-binding XRE family transcriptional regulator